MNYINKGKRDILIFPKFKNVDKIQKIRSQYDELYEILPPHITLAFPFESELSNDELKNHLIECLNEIHNFKIKMKGVSLNKDERVNTNYIFLNFVEGKENIVNIHNLIYEKVLKTKLPFEYIPHITLGCTNNEYIEFDFEEEFDSIIDIIAVESIGENEESIIEFEVKLSNK